MTNAKRRGRMDLAYSCFLCCGAASLIIGAGVAVFAHAPMDAGAQVGGSMLFGLFVMVPAFLLGSVALVCGVVVTLLLRGPPGLVALTVMTVLMIASSIGDLRIGSIPASTVSLLVYGALAVAIPLLWFSRWRARFPGESEQVAA